MVSQAARQAGQAGWLAENLSFGDVLKFNIRLLVSVFFFLMLYLMIDGLIQNSQAVKKRVQPQKGQGEKRCEIQGDSQEMAVMVG